MKVEFGEFLNEIGDCAFYGCTNLEQVVFGQDLMYIGSMAFYKCLNLHEITLPVQLAYIGSNAFTMAGIKHAVVECDTGNFGSGILSQCHRLTKITIGAGVRTIADKFAFRCEALTVVEMPSSVQAVGKNAFDGSRYLENLPDGIHNHILLDGRSSSGAVHVPDYITVIAGGAFYENEGITSIELPDSLVFIGSRAFCACRALREIKLPVGIVELHEGTFAYCDALETVDAQNIREIGDNGFYGCRELIHAPVANAVKIGNHSFAGCASLEHLPLDACIDFGAMCLKNTPFMNNMQGNPLVIVNNVVIDGTRCVGDVTIPDGVVAIAQHAFAQNRELTSIRLPQTLEKIEAAAFWGCLNLKDVHIAGKLQYIGEKAFEKCASIETLSVDVLEIRKQAFSLCILLKDARLVNTVQIADEAFYGCSSLESCQCAQVKVIGAGSFSDCESLINFNFENAASVGERAFINCNSLQEIFLRNGSIGAHAFEDCGRVRKISLTDTKYSSYSFSGCAGLVCISVDGQTHNINNYGFISDGSVPACIKAVYVNALSCFDINGRTLENYHNNGRFVCIPSGIERINDSVFKDCPKLEHVIIPSSVAYIGARAFWGTPWLRAQVEQTKMVIVNNNLIDGEMCNGDVVIPETVKYVSGWAFANNFTLNSIRFSSNRTKVMEYAFRNCINLKHVVLPDSNKMYHMMGMDSIRQDLPKLVLQIFRECLNCFKVDESGHLYECTGNIETLYLPTGIKSIGDGVFKDSNLLTHIILTEDVVSIGERAFESCKWLVSVRGGINVSSIGKRAFWGCYALENVEYSDSLSSVGENAFKWCPISIKISSGVGV